MQNKKIRIKPTVVENSVCVHKKENSGITLIALIITIIVMLILVAVTVNVALNGGLLKTAKEATKGTKTEKDKELQLSSGKIEIDGIWYSSMEDYLNNKPYEELPEGWTVAETKPEGWSDKVTAITDGKNTIPLPQGYQVSKVKEEQTLSRGLVITDGENEFVWIPLLETDFQATYSYGTNYLEPTRLTDCDSQDILNYYYGQNEDGTNYYNFDTDFNYTLHYSEMVTSVNRYDGFYIGRYETTIDENGKIGSIRNAEVLTSEHKLKDGTNTTINDEFHYRWWGLYDSQRNSNVKGNGDYIQTNMIWGQQWDAMIACFDNTNQVYTSTSVETLSTSGEQNSGQAKYTYNGETISDDIYNIYDLRGNLAEWSAEAFNIDRRVNRGRRLLL